MTRVYIAGPMTSIPQQNVPAFDYAAVQWRDAGYEVVNPAELTREYFREQLGQKWEPDAQYAGLEPGGALYRALMAKDIAQLLTCRAIALLPGWRKSKGVATELAVADCLGFPRFDAVSFAPIAAESALEEAQRLVHGDRGEAYGHPIDDYTATGRMWGAILGTPDIDPRIACLMMTAVKMSRESRKHKRDNLVDGAGYFECASMVVDEQVRRRASSDGAR